MYDFTFVSYSKFNVYNFACVQRPVVVGLFKITMQTGTLLCSRDICSGYLVYPPSLWLFAEGHGEAETRVPGIPVTWHFIPQTCCPGSSLSQVCINLYFEIISKRHAGHKPTAMGQ